MKKSHAQKIIVAIVIFTMFGSAAGIALVYGGYFPEQGQAHQQPEEQLQGIINRDLAGFEISAILRSGRVLFEHFYPPDCAECLAVNGVFQQFVRRYPNFVVVELVESGNRTIQMIGSNGDVISLENETITDQRLFELFCSAVLAKPKECFLAGI